MEYVRRAQDVVARADEVGFRMRPATRERMMSLNAARVTTGNRAAVRGLEMRVREAYRLRGPAPGPARQPSPERRNPLAGLPTEVSDQILQHLNRRTLTRLGAVNRSSRLLIEPRLDASFRHVKDAFIQAQLLTGPRSIPARAVQDGSGWRWTDAYGWRWTTNRRRLDGITGRKSFGNVEVYWVGGPRYSWKFDVNVTAGGRTTAVIKYRNMLTRGVYDIPAGQPNDGWEPHREMARYLRGRRARLVEEALRRHGGRTRWL